MKQIALILSLFFLIGIGLNTDLQANTAVELSSITAKNKTVTFKVYGNCGMCKRTIENALKDVKGIKSASWDIQKKMITVTYNPKKIELKDIHKKIAAAGYDTDKAKAKDEVYNNLHGCCQYDRPKGK